jgi:phosphate transport system substrate-binding protein
MKLKTLMAGAMVTGAAAVVLFSSAVAHAVDITGAGATFPYPIYAKWAEDYKKISGTNMNYQSIGSGGGIRQIQAKTVDFGASDMPLTKEALDKDGLVQFPAIIGGVVPVVNIDGIKPGELKLTGAVLADIFLGKVKTWNDADHGGAPFRWFRHHFPVRRLFGQSKPRVENQSRRRFGRRLARRCRR